MTAADLHQFTGLPGVRCGKLEGALVSRTPSAILYALRKHRLASCAGDHGAITVWKDDAGMWRCAHSRWCAVVDDQVFKTKVAVRKWLVDTIPNIEQSQ